MLFRSAVGRTMLCEMSVAACKHVSMYLDANQVCVRVRVCVCMCARASACLCVYTQRKNHVASLTST